MKRLVSVALVFAAVASPPGRLGAGTAAPYGLRFRRAGFIAAAAAEPIPLADVITQVDAAQASLEEPSLAVGLADGTTITRDLPAVTQEISANLRRRRSS